MGSLVSAEVANIYIEKQARNTAVHSPQIWRCCVDDTFSMCDKQEKLIP